MPDWYEFFTKLILSIIDGDFKELYGILSTFLSQNEQNCDK
jgi:hypothetical protein